MNSPINKDIVPGVPQSIHSKFFHGQMHSAITPSIKRTPHLHAQLSQSKFDALKQFKMNKGSPKPKEEEQFDVTGSTFKGSF